MISRHAWIALHIPGCGGVENEPDASEDGGDHEHAEAARSVPPDVDE